LTCSEFAALVVAELRQVIKPFWWIQLLTWRSLK